MNYFNKFPTINYNGSLAKNILARSKLSDATRSNKTIFYPYTMAEADRVDNLSDQYYDDPGYSWLIWFTNDIIDPYYEMPLSEEQLYELITAKYGSLEYAMRKIVNYRNNWYGNDTKLSVDQYNALTDRFKKYWDPVVNNDYVVQSYTRKRVDTMLATNKTITMGIANTEASFTVGEEVRVDAANYGFCTFSNSSVVSLQHITGSFNANASISGVESNTVAIVTSVTTLSETQAATDPQYWSAMTLFDLEQEANELRKDIKLLDVRYKAQAESELKRVMNQ